MNANTKGSQGNQEPILSFNDKKLFLSLTFSRFIEDGEEEWEG